MDLQFAIEVNRQTRKNILLTVEGLTEKQINTIEDVIQFIYAHDALHWGIILSMLKVVGK